MDALPQGDLEVQDQAPRVGELPGLYLLRRGWWVVVGVRIQVVLLHRGPGPAVLLVPVIAQAQRLKEVLGGHAAVAAEVDDEDVPVLAGDPGPQLYRPVGLQAKAEVNQEAPGGVLEVAEAALLHPGDEHLLVEGLDGVGFGVLGIGFNGFVGHGGLRGRDLPGRVKGVPGGVVDDRENLRGVVALLVPAEGLLGRQGVE